MSDVPEADTPKGDPEIALQIPFNCQPPAIHFSGPLLAQRWPAPNGSLYEPFTVRLCGMSELFTARFSP